VVEGGGALVHRVGELMTRSSWVHLAAPCVVSEQMSWLGDEPRRRTLGMTGLPQQAVTALRGGRPPLLLAGVVLAGAQRSVETSGEGRLEKDDGILSAEEIAGLDLAGTDLVVLGQTEPGGRVEAAPVLQHAFHRAGARAVLGSLWTTDPKVRRRLLERFYANLRQQKMPPLEALRQAQVSLLRDPETASVQAWAGWTMSGHPGLLYLLPGGSDASGGPPDLLWRRHGPLLAAGLLLLLGVAAWLWRRGGRPQEAGAGAAELQGSRPEKE
jgi:hypothetical protein